MSYEGKGNQCYCHHCCDIIKGFGETGSYVNYEKNSTNS